MSLSVHDQHAVDGFAEETAQFWNAYRYAWLKYFAVRGKDGYELLQGVLTLTTSQPLAKARVFRTDDVICEELQLADSGIDIRQFITETTRNSLPIRGVPLHFAPENGDHHRAHHVAFDGSLIIQHGFASQLTLAGANDIWTYIQNSVIERQLKTAPTPYDGFRDLLADFQLSTDLNRNRTVEIRTTHVARIAQSSYVRCTECHVEMLLALGLPESAVQLGLVITEVGGNKTRTAKLGSEIVWGRDRGDNHGTCMLDVPDQSTVDCYLTYAGLPQDRHLLRDSPKPSNTLRIAHQVFDPDATALKNVIENRSPKKKDEIHLELTVGAILAMRGFRTIHIDGIPSVEGPDIIASDDRGNLLLVECTSDLPRAAHKVGNLHRRFRAVRDAIESADNPDTKVAAILAVSLSRGDLALDLKDVEGQRILLWSRDELEELRSDDSPPDSNAFFDEVICEIERRSSAVLLESTFPLDSGSADL